jgi:SnoaL-like domain
MLELQEISDRLEIQQLVVEYSEAIDTKNFDLLDNVFTPDAYIDYRAMGGIDGRYPEVKPWIADTLNKFPAYQHLIANHRLKINGDSGTGRLMCFNPMQVGEGDNRQVMLLGLWYLDKYVRTEDGWRISERVEERGWDHNVPLEALQKMGLWNE